MFFELTGILGRSTSANAISSILILANIFAVGLLLAVFFAALLRRHVG